MVMILSTYLLEAQSNYYHFATFVHSSSHEQSRSIGTIRPMRRLSDCLVVQQAGLTY